MKRVLTCHHHSHYSQWQTRHVRHFLGNIDCKWHYTPHQDSFFVFRCYTGSTETFINIISNTIASTIPLITVSSALKLVRRLRFEKWKQTYHKPDGRLTLPVLLSALISKNTVIFCAEPTFQLSEARGTKKYEKTYRQTDKTPEPFVYLYQLPSVYLYQLLSQKKFFRM